MCDVQPFVFFILSVRIWPSKIIRSWSVDDQFSTFQLRGARSPSSSRVLEQIGILSIGWSKINDEITVRLAWTQRFGHFDRYRGNRIANNIIPRHGRMEPRSSTSFHLQSLFETIWKFETKERSRVNVDYAIIRRNTAILKSLFRSFV